MIRNSFLSQRGQSLVSVLVALGLLGLLISGFTSMMSTQWRETRALNEKLASLDLQQLLTASLANGSVCEYVLKNPTVLTFDSTNLPATITLPSPDTNGNPATLYRSVLNNPAPPPAVIPGPVAVQVGEAASLSSPTLIVSSIQLQISSQSGGVFAANWLVNFDASKSVRALRPVSIAATLTADTSTPTAAKVLTCSSQTQNFACVSGSVRAKTGATQIMSTDGYTPSSFNDVFFTFTSNPNDWGIGCRAGWHLTGCALSNANNSGFEDWDLKTEMRGGLPACNSDNDEYNSDGSTTAICCKIL